jgi:hypothetical protein
MSIENKGASRLWCPFQSIKNPTKALSLFNACLNATEMRQSFLSQEFRSSIAPGTCPVYRQFVQVVAMSKHYSVFGGSYFVSPRRTFYWRCHMRATCPR